MRLLNRVRHWLTTRLYKPSRAVSPYTWIGQSRVAVGAMPMPGSFDGLVVDGISHVVNCRARLQTAFSGDLARERETFGEARVACAPMWDNGRPKAPEDFAAAAHFAVEALRDEGAGVLIHCQQGRRRSVMVAYAALRLHGMSDEDAAREILAHRREGHLVPEYRRSVEEWLAAGAPIPV